MRQLSPTTLAVLLAALLGAACGSPAPLTPTPAAIVDEGAAADGSTLKIAAPALVSPIGGARVSGAIVLVFSNVHGQFATFPVSYEIEVRSPAGAVVVSARIPAASGLTTSYTVTATLPADTTFTWRVRAVRDAAFGPWSATGSYATAAASYLIGNEIFDPLTNGITAGIRVGNTQFLPGIGIKMLTQDSHVRYDLPTNLQAGELSMMVTGVDEGSPGDKSKIMSMQEGGSDITDNDYRFTAELRGRSYVTPGAVTFRIITGDSGDHGRIYDGVRTAVPFNDEQWYFWKFTWQTGTARLEVRVGSETGAIIYSSQIGTGSNPYRPVPHVVYIGAPVGRAGAIDATIGGLIAKNVWLSSRPRPAFPTAAELAYSLLSQPGR
jgi:hypothetical protein